MRMLSFSEGTRLCEFCGRQKSACESTTAKPVHSFIPYSLFGMPVYVDANISPFGAVMINPDKRVFVITNKD